MIELRVMAPCADPRLAHRDGRDAATRRQLAALEIRGPLRRRCEGCGSTDHGAPIPPSGAASRSRSRDWHAFAASDRPARLGLDIEHLARARQAQQAAPRFIGAGDHQAEPRPNALRTFTRKEAIVKARGVGMHADLRAQPTALTDRSHAGWTATSEGWWLFEGKVGPLLFCLACEQPQAVELVIDGSDRLARPRGASRRGSNRVEHNELVSRQESLGRRGSTRAALIPIKKSDAWWDLAQDERRRVFEESSHHIAMGLEYLPAVARRLHHGRDLGEPFDLLTWFEFAPEHAAAFEELVQRLRATEEWAYVERDIDLRLARQCDPASRRSPVRARQPAVAA